MSIMLINVSAIDSEGRKVYTFENQCALQVPEKYSVRDIVGRGAYGVVCSAVNTETEELVAIKKISRLFEDTVDAKRVLREVKLLGFLHHPNVLSLKGLFRPSNDSTFNEVYVVTELMETNLQALLRSPRVRLKAGHCQYLTLQLLCALQYIHSAGVLHRDLKPGNLLTDADCNLRLCDFGLARGMGENMTRYVVTRWYRPPELLLVCEHYDYSVDLWGVGCLAAEMITGKTLFPGHDYINQVNLIVELLGKPRGRRDLPYGTPEEAARYLESLPETNGKSLRDFCPDLRRRFDETSFFDSFDDEDELDMSAGPAPQQLSPAQYYTLFEDFLFGMIKYNPTERLTAKQAISHPWLADVRGGQMEVGGCEAGDTFFWDGDDKQLTTEQLRQLFIEEIAMFHKE